MQIVIVLSLVVVISIAVCLAYYCIALQKKLSVVEYRLTKVEAVQNEELTQDQAEYRDRLQKQYATLFKQIEINVASDLNEARSETTNLVKKSRAEFDKKLKDEFEKAIEQIKFDEIEYKRTITKKRKEFNRKNSKNAKPERIWRYIDEE